MDEHTLPPTDAEPHDEHSLREFKLAKLQDLQAAGNDPFRHVRWDRNQCAAGIESVFAQLEKEAIVVSIAGRVMSRREHGKAGFADLQDESGRMQLYFKTDIVGAESFEAFKALDLGDIVGVKGTVFKTRTGQVTVQVSEWALLSKILQALPEKWHGLQDVEQRFRQRYADMIVNRDVFNRLRKRSKAVAEIRRFLDQRGFLEMETPLLHAICGGATAEPFVTHWNALKADYYLRIAIELHLKRLIVGGMERVYEIGRVFRNEGVSTRHNPEFTMLELYWAYVDYTDVMQLTEDLIAHLAANVFKHTEVEFGEHHLSFKAPFRRMTFDAALREYAGCGLADLRTLEDVKREAARLGVHLPKDGGYEKCLDEVWKERVEPHLIQPTFIIDFPLWISPLAKRIPPDELELRGYPRDLELCYRFELFIATMEIAPSFSELNDPIDQRARMQNQILDHLPDDLRSVITGEFEAILADETTTPNGEGRFWDMAEAELHGKLYLMEEHFETGMAFDADTVDEQEDLFDPEYFRKCVWTVRALTAMGIKHFRLSEALRLLPLVEGQAKQHPGDRGYKEILQTIESSNLLLSTIVDEDFITALEYGMPPTGGLGIGIDRLIMILSGTPSIREVIAFPQLRQK